MSTAGLNWTYETSFPSSIEHAHALIEESLAELRQLACWSDREVFAVQLALEESFINAITHGNKSDKGKMVHFARQVTPEVARFRIEDEGPGFEPANLPDPTDPRFIDIASGRGVLLIRSFMSNVDYNEKGNAVVMEKVRNKEQ
ncbi:MAG TPA: ATP-binding protein [Planctomycetaceae bacterium]|nr:ATP-binding protein [Planctomycetaceae bacterium]